MAQRQALDIRNKTGPCRKAVSGDGIQVQNALSIKARPSKPMGRHGDPVRRFILSLRSSASPVSAMLTGNGKPCPLHPES
jgi:hypothetical protein